MDAKPKDSSKHRLHGRGGDPAGALGLVHPAPAFRKRHRDERRPHHQRCERETHRRSRARQRHAARSSPAQHRLLLDRPGRPRLHGTIAGGLVVPTLSGRPGRPRLHGGRHRARIGALMPCTQLTSLRPRSAGDHLRDAVGVFDVRKPRLGGKVDDGSVVPQRLETVVLARFGLEHMRHERTVVEQLP